MPHCRLVTLHTLNSPGYASRVTYGGSILKIIDLVGDFPSINWDD